MDELICFCFGYSEEDIRRDVREHGRSMVLEHIMAEKRKGGCRCRETNPSGR
ncbi:hypothetical protein GF1_11220 [Desulfolithobacter dissulfuricans]|uniref:BFD-like (2Fe-2S) protein n=1 Tax=Desulfolithobacter dissulfuricans TaxID=2795293 RepID=A0A915TZK5_9BACT|nr:hypothetical protein [Desulfolithobacter dissulfuricans]BCO08746.1 hypothetical protein GF1_11220 [Desulfolithobacter dissulfuricans]